MKRAIGIIVLLFLAISSLAAGGVTIVSESKQPFEEIGETVDFSARLAAGDNIATCDVTATNWGGASDNTVFSWDNTMIAGQSVSYVRKGGQDGRRYTITLRCTSDNGVRLEQDVIFKVQEY